MSVAPPLTFDDFAPHLGKPFTVQAHNGAIQLRLAEAQELPGSLRDGGAFRLEFHGPPQPTLAQGTYRFLVGGRPADIFIVALGQSGGNWRYEAIFF
jgi:hypothetical protein